MVPKFAGVRRIFAPLSVKCIDEENDDYHDYDRTGDYGEFEPPGRLAAIGRHANLPKRWTPARAHRGTMEALEPPMFRRIRFPSTSGRRAGAEGYRQMSQVIGGDFSDRLQRQKEN